MNRFNQNSAVPDYLRRKADLVQFMMTVHLELVFPHGEHFNTRVCLEAADELLANTVEETSRRGTEKEPENHDYQPASMEIPDPGSQLSELLRQAIREKKDIVDGVLFFGGDGD